MDQRNNHGPDNVKLKSGATLEGTLSQIMDLFRQNNPGGQGKLNYVVIGQSESLQHTSVDKSGLNPRIMLKSPNSELMVTFNTDPKAPGYQSLEIMRWNGRLGRYEFQEVNFGEKKVDLSGSKCMECHKEPSMRPNWDTYRAWAGVIPSRDDMLESVTHRLPGHLDGSTDLDPKGGAQPDARAYLGFLDRVASEKEKNPRSRLGMLDIPFDDERQLGAYVTAAGKTSDQLTPREKVEMIRRRVAEEGFYRIRHFPDVEQSKSNPNMAVNLDAKTAPWAGPSQMAFDQMMAQNMCRVVTDLRTNPNFPKFGKALAYLYACASYSPNLDSVFPPAFQQKILSYYNSTNFSNLADLDPGQRPTAPVKTVGELRDLVRADTNSSHSKVDAFKFARHGNLLKNYLMTAERMPESKAISESEFYTRDVMTPEQTNFHAINDPGGVRGVEEASGDIVSESRLLLESFGVPVNHWSLARGRDNAYNSFSFSDQFVLLTTQPLWQEMKRQAGSCSQLAEQAKHDLEAVTAPVAKAESGRIPDPSTSCQAEAMAPTSSVDLIIEDSSYAAATALLPEVRTSMNKCLTCHDGSMAPEFTGLEKFVNNQGDDEFLNFISSSRSSLYDRPLIEVVEMKLGVLPFPNGEDLGSSMPPSNWQDNAQFAHEMHVPEDQAKDVRRRMIASVLTTVAGKRNKATLRTFCEAVNNSRQKTDQTPAGSASATSGATKQ
jgi:hypothetical protein